MPLHAVIMAGGVGSRFWPRSRRATPKQFLDVFGPASLIQSTFARLGGLVPPERVLVVTNADYAAQTREHLPQLPEANLLAEPAARNTAPCVAWAAAHLARRDPDATMAVLPADAVVQDVPEFHAVLRAAAAKADEHRPGQPGPLVTVGIRPTHPETGYGYVQFDADAAPPNADEPRALPVKTFAEKPDLATAERFLDSGDFLWNGGIFVMRAAAVLEAMRRHLPDVHGLFAPIAAGDGDPDRAAAHAYEHTPKVSLDVGVMEQADDVWTVPGDFGWSDVGDWRAVHELHEKDADGNRAEGTVILQDTLRSYARAEEGRLLVLVGMRDCVAVDTGDAVLVCHRDAAQQVKHVVDFLGSRGMEDYT